MIDFGFSGPVAGRDKCGKLTTFVGTQTYTAPELLASTIANGYNGQACDIFALGVILFVLVVQSCFPFRDAKQFDPSYRYLWSYDAESFWD